jgi:hypothetical protein
MRKIVRTTALAAVLATALSATTVNAAESRTRTPRERTSIGEIAKKVMKRFFGVSSLSEVISIPIPENNRPSNGGTTTGGE